MARKAYSSEEVAKRMEALPEAAADFLYSSDMNGTIKGIADKHSLHIDQMGLLEAETGQLILGLTEPQDFAPYVAESLKVPSEQALAIAKDINEQVMSKIRTSMGQPASGTTPVAASSAPTTSTPPIGAPTPSVVMPSSPKPVVPPTLAPITAPVAAQKPVPPPVAAPKPAGAPTLAAADTMLSEKKVTPPATAPTPAAAAAPAAPITPAASPMPKVDPAQPQNYKTDPYREPVE